MGDHAFCIDKRAARLRLKSKPRAEPISWTWSIMPYQRVHCAYRLATLLTAGVCIAGAAAAGHPTDTDLAIVNVRIYPGPDRAPIDDGVILIHHGTISTVGTAPSIPIPLTASVINGHGGIVTAGFWNSHVHLIKPELLDAAKTSASTLDDTFSSMLTRWGFTTVFDLSSSLTNTAILRRRIEHGEVSGPKILTTGDGFFPEGGTPIYIKDFMQTHHFPSWEVSTPEQAATRARRQLQAGADAVKLFTGAIVGGSVGILPMRTDIAEAVVDAAHQQGKPAFAHPSNVAGLTVAMNAGVDVLAHTTADGGPWSPALVQQLLAHHMALIPTLTLFDIEFSKTAPPDVVKHALADCIQQVKAYSEAGGQILFGTDVGFIEKADTSEEYELMGRAMSWRGILASLTTAPASRFGYAAQKGRVAAGMDADLVILASDPEKNPAAFANVRMTIRGGRIIWR